MSTPSRPERFAISPTNTARALSAATTPGSRVLQSSLSDETIWKRLKSAGFDEESIKRRDKAALIAYIAKLEAEIYDHQHHMGLLIMERKDWTSKLEQLKASIESSEIQLRIDQAAHIAALAEAKKREDNLKRALGVEKECIANIEKAMHDMRIEAAETKVAGEIKLAEARTMVEDAQKRFTESVEKLHAAESFQAEANRYHRAAETKLHEVEAREDDLRRRILSFKSECDAKENEIVLERQALSERQKVVKEGQERLLDAQALLNQREEHIIRKTQNLNQFEKELHSSKTVIENEQRALNEEKSNLNLRLASLATKEEDAIKREIMLNKKEQELLVLQEKLASKEIAEIQKLKSEHEIVEKKRMSEFEAEQEMKRKLVEDDIEAKRRAWELREVDLRHQEELILEKEHELGVNLRALNDKENDMKEKLMSLEEKKKGLDSSEKEIELKKTILQKEQEEINNAKLDLLKSLSSLEDRNKQVNCAKENAEAMKIETKEYLVLETKLKEEIDMVRAEKLELMVRAEELNVEKAKFEAEWESIDEKREELRNEAECIANEKRAITTFLKDERASSKLERDVMREQYELDVEALYREREEFRSQMVQEQSGWFNKIQQERADFLVDIEMQKRELENCFENRREELESDFREREKAFEQVKTKELDYINSLKENVANDLEYVASEMRRLESERVEIKMDREMRDREWSEIGNSIEELKTQMLKLKEQRELLHADRQDIHDQIAHLKKLEHLEISLNRIVAVEPTEQNNSANGFLVHEIDVKNGDMVLYNKIENVENVSGLDVQGSAGGTPNSAPVSWFKRCTELIFKQSPEKTLHRHGESARLALPKHLDSSNGCANAQRNMLSTNQRENSSGESKLIFEIPSIRNDVNNVKENFSQLETLAGRKRRIANSSNGLADILLDEGQNTKKRRQHEDTTAHLTEETITHSAVSMQGNEVEAVSIMQTEGVSEPAKVVIIDKIIKVSEVTCVNADADKDAIQNELGRLQSSIAELVHDGLQGDGTDGCFISSYLENEEQMAQEPFADVQHLIEQGKPQEDAKSQQIDQAIEITF